jgi:Arc/MetJ-type ribon-helix-helix transcriptional regulator
VKLSVSLPEDDVDFIDRYATEHGVESRSAVLRRAVSLLRASELGDDYAAAWDEWESSEAALWDVTIADGLPTGTD